MSHHVLANNNKASSLTKHLQSEIINQKKQFIFKIEQTSDFVYPNEEYKYYIYLKNISGVDINNIHVVVNNSSDVNIDTESEGDPIEIGTMGDGEVKMIYLTASCNNTGAFFNHFICYGDGTGLFYKTMKINCSYNNISDEIIHRIHIYNFTPYEDTYTMDIDNFSDEVTQLFKTQKLPYKAKEQPFPEQYKEDEASIRPFSNVESESFVSQHDEIGLKGFLDNIEEKKEIYNSARNTKEHYYQYIGRENFNENSLESFEGENLFNIIENINKKSQYFKATFLKTGTNQLLNDFKEYNPNGFIYRFGLLSSEIYHYLGVLPTYSYMSDYLFRWAPSKNQPLNLIPQKKAMNWNQHKWAGHGWRVYRIATKEYMNTDEWKQNFENGIEDRWTIIEDFDTLKTAKDYVERQKYFDEVVKSQLSLDYDKYEYLIKENFLDNGVFYINIPLDDVPTNFYLLNTENIEAIIQKSKPFGVKPLVRYTIERFFNHSFEFTHYPRLKPHININMGNMDEMSYFIQTKKYKDVVEKICDTNVVITKLVPHGKTTLYNGYQEEDTMFFKDDIHPRIIESDLQTADYYLNKYYTCPHKENNICTNKFPCTYNNNNNCEYKINNDNIPDNNIEIDIQQENEVESTSIDNDLSTLFNLADILYQNNCDNICFSLPFKIYHKPDFETNLDTKNNFITEWAKNHNFNSFDLEIEKTSANTYKIIGNNFEQTYNIFKLPIINREVFNNLDCELGLGVIDNTGRYHYLSAKYDGLKNMDSIQYSTSFNNGYKTHKSGYHDISGISFCVINIKQKQVIIFFVEEDGMILHYFHHIIVSDISDIFLFMSNDLIEENDKVINYLNCEKIRNHDIIFETPFVYSYKTYNPLVIANGDNWTNLYRIDNAQNSYTYINNMSNTMLQPDDILLHFDDINIPNNCIIKDIKLKSLIDSKTVLNVQTRCAVQTNNNFEDSLLNTISFTPNNIECYPANKNSQYYYTNEIEIAKENDNKKIIQECESNLKKNKLFNESVNINIEDYINDFNKFVNINKGFWIEISDFTYNSNNCNNVKTLELVLEGYNEGPQINLIYQLLCLNESIEPKQVLIPSGYFNTKINIPFINSFTLDELRIKFKFNKLNHNIKLFNSYLDIDFKQKERQYIDYIFTDDISVKNKQNIDINCFNKTFTPEKINNGFTINLSFDELSPGEYYRIYSAELEIIYQETNMNLLINKNQFTYEPYNDEFTSISGINTNSYLSGMFYNDVPTVLQLESTIDADNYGLELKDTLFQSFIAKDNNITSIELFPNGFMGNPDSTIKIGLYSNHGNTPGYLIKEVYANGWTKSNSELKNLYSIKYNFNVDNLEIDEKYWIKIQIDNPTENSYYLLRYTTEQQKNFKLLLRENNDYINTFGCLQFNIYSKNLTRSFYQLPTAQDYFNNPYILIGLHKGVGTIEQLRVKKKGVL